MAALGALTARDPVLSSPALIPITDYNVIRGRYLGAITLKDTEPPLATLIDGLDTYIVRQISIVYRQLWPSHGQRFPQ